MSKNKYPTKRKTRDQQHTLSKESPKHFQKQAKQSMTMPQGSTNNGRDQWSIYWQAQNQPWRIEPEIDIERQKVLTECLTTILPQIEKDIYPFKKVELRRADIEWLLATHENGRGPVNLSDENQRERLGLDLRGTDLRGIDLSGLPLACMRGGLRSEERILTQESDKISDLNQVNVGTVNLEGADLTRAHLEGAILSRASLKRAILNETHLRETNLSEAHLEEASFNRAYLKECNLMEAHLEGAILSQARMEKIYLFGAYLKEASLIEAHLEGATLREAHLERTNLIGANLEGADLRTAHLERANLTEAHLEGANLERANLKGAIFGPVNWLEKVDHPAAHLEGANLNGTNLEEANLSHTYLEGANLSHALLNGANFYRASFGGKRLLAEDLERIQTWKEDFPETLTPTDLRRAVFNSRTNLEGVILGSKDCGFISLADVYWGEVNLALVDWRQVNMLGDEREARQPQKSDGSPKDNNDQINEYREAVRANRQLAVVLRNQGLNEEASYFAYRAQVLQMEVLRKQVKIWQKLLVFVALVQRTGAWILLAWLWYWLCKLSDRMQTMKVWALLSELGHWLHKLGTYIFSLLLNVVGGYGYRPMRSLFTYLIAIFVFATLYYIFGQEVKPHISPLAALVLSMTSFHGRGFFPGENVGLDNPLTVLAAIEAGIGLIIEISFIAAFTQRFFGK